MVMHPHVVKMITIVVITDVPAFEFVAFKKTCTNGITSGFERMLSTSPRQKQNVISITYPRIPLINTVHIMARGRTKDASLISSAKVNKIGVSHFLTNAARRPDWEIRAMNKLLK